MRCDARMSHPQLCVRRFASEGKREWCAQLQHVGKSPPSVDTVTCGPGRCEKCNFGLPLHKHVSFIKKKATRSFEAWIATYLPMHCDVPENRNSKLQFSSFQNHLLHGADIATGPVVCVCLSPTCLLLYICILNEIMHVVFPGTAVTVFSTSSAS